MPGINLPGSSKGIVLALRIFGNFGRLPESGMAWIENVQ